LINGSHGGIQYPELVAAEPKVKRARGMIRRRGNSLQIVVYAGVDQRCPGLD
jgi:hypothetical protein